MRRIAMADAGFLIMEKRQTPTHVGGINLFTLPKGVNEQRYLSELVGVLKNAEEYLKHTELTARGLFHKAWKYGSEEDREKLPEEDK